MSTLRVRDGGAAVACVRIVLIPLSLAVLSASIHALPFTAQGSEIQVNTHVTGLQCCPALAMDAVGNFVIAWEE